MPSSDENKCCRIDYNTLCLLYIVSCRIICAAGLLAVVRFFILSFGFPRGLPIQQGLAGQGAVLLAITGAMRSVSTLLASRTLSAKLFPLFLVAWLVCACLFWIGMAAAPVCVPHSLVADSLLFASAFASGTIIGFYAIIVPIASKYPTSVHDHFHDRVIRKGDDR
jgi:hypothetical protein